jgi:hypothetical protein
MIKIYLSKLHNSLFWGQKGTQVRELWYLTPLSTIFHLYRGGNMFYIIAL